MFEGSQIIFVIVAELLNEIMGSKVTGQCINHASLFEVFSYVDKVLYC